jgi:hypothetical protein
MNMDRCHVISLDKQIKRLGEALTRHTGRGEAEKTRHLFQRLVILLAKALLFLKRAPCHPSSEIEDTDQRNINLQISMNSGSNYKYNLVFLLICDRSLYK